jgi:hypothetical protein
LESGIEYTHAYHPEIKNKIMSYKTLDDRKEKIRKSEYDRGEKLIYEWVKTNQIKLKEFRDLNKYNREILRHDNC